MFTRHIQTISRSATKFGMITLNGQSGHFQVFTAASTGMRHQQSQIHDVVCQFITMFSRKAICLMTCMNHWYESLSHQLDIHVCDSTGITVHHRLHRISFLKSQILFPIYHTHWFPFCCSFFYLPSLLLEDIKACKNHVPPIPKVFFSLKVLWGDLV